MSDLATHLAAQAPSLVLLANGGEVALQDIEWNVREGREIIVLDGSGRLADEIAAAVRQGERKTRFMRGRKKRVATLARQGRMTLFDLSAPPAELIELLRRRLKGD